MSITIVFIIFNILNIQLHESVEGTQYPEGQQIPFEYGQHPYEPPVKQQVWLFWQ